MWLQHVQDEEKTYCVNMLSVVVLFVDSYSIMQLMSVLSSWFRAIHTGTPTYLASQVACELHRHQPLRALRSGTTTTLHRPHASSDFHKDSFAVSAPATWNNIPASIRDSATLVTSKLRLKHISSTPLTRHATDDCHPWAPPIHFSDMTWHQLK